MKEASAKGFPLITHQNIGYNLDNSHINPSKAPVVLEGRGIRNITSKKPIVIFMDADAMKNSSLGDVTEYYRQAIWHIQVPNPSPVARAGRLMNFWQGPGRARGPKPEYLAEVNGPIKKYARRDSGRHLANVL